MCSCAHRCRLGWRPWPTYQDRPTLLGLWLFQRLSNDRFCYRRAAHLQPRTADKGRDWVAAGATALRNPFYQLETFIMPMLPSGACLLLVPCPPAAFPMNCATSFVLAPAPTSPFPPLATDSSSSVTA